MKKKKNGGQNYNSKSKFSKMNYKNFDKKQVQELLNKMPLKNLINVTAKIN